MRDIFDATVLCDKCASRMEKASVLKQGYKLRALQCPDCKAVLIHPVDEEKFNKFKNLKGKTYNVKLRIIGNSHAISIPKEIVDFIHQQERMMDDMVSLCFEDMRKLSLMFGNEDVIERRIEDERTK